jgi:hypothetical protein
MNTLVNVLVELDDGNQQTFIARIEGEKGSEYTVRYLSPSKKMLGDRPIYKYEKDVYNIDKECIDEYYDSPFEEDAGLQAVEGGWVLDESDSDDYNPSESEETDDESESLTESEED